ncbi:MAG TPA: class I SAM-dependent methyltransferase [Rhodopila sp.]|jgi:SAM-dependent methyltransferase
MSVSDYLHCPDCQGRLSREFARDALCSVCGRTVRVVDEIIDLFEKPFGSGTERCRGMMQECLLTEDLPTQIKSAAGDRWPPALGNTIELGCGLGAMTQAILADETMRSLLVVDSDLTVLRTCRGRFVDMSAGRPVMFAALDGALAVIRDAVADTVIGAAVLSGINDTRGFLTTVHRIMKTSGRALFVVPNRRYYQAVCLALAEALTQRYTREASWPNGYGPVLGMLEQTRRLLVHQGDLELLQSLEDKHLFDSDLLEDMGGEIGFGTAHVLPLDPDPAGGRTITRILQDAGATDDFAREFGPLAATIGRPYLSLLDHQDSSAFSLLWLTKATGPIVRIFTSRPSGPPIAYRGPDAAVGGVMPRWSIEVLGRDTPAGVLMTVGGWCLGNVDLLWVRVTLDGIARQTPVWRHRADVHEVLNRAHVYHSLNGLCSGLDGELLFEGVHPVDGGCGLRLEIILAGGLIITGPAPERLSMDQQTVIAH